MRRAAEAVHPAITDGKPSRRADLEDEFSISVAPAKHDLLALRESVTLDQASKTCWLKKARSRR